MSTNFMVDRDLDVTNISARVSLNLPRVIIATYPVKIKGSLAYDISSGTLWYSNGLEWLPISGQPIPIVPNVQVEPIKPIGSLVYDSTTNVVWYSNGTEWLPMSTTPVTSDISTFPILQQGATVYDLITNRIWYSNGVDWLPIASSILVVADVQVYPVQPEGTIVYDQATNTIWYSDGTQWIPMSSTPSVPDASVYPILPAGTLIYDELTQTVWYSDGTAWNPIDSNTSGVVMSALTIYANAGTGSDTNDGLTPATAVQTIQRALDVISTYLVYNGTIQLLGNTPFDLGTDSNLNFFPATTRVGNLVIKGTRLNEVNDTVASFAHNIGPFNTWTQVTGTTGGYTASLYQGWFVQNNTKNTFYSILDNAVGTVDTIAGDGAPNGQIDAWTNGDSFSLYTLESVITFSGTIDILNSSNDTVRFQDVWIQPSSGATLKNPLLPVTTYNACRMDTNSQLSYTGSMNLNGVYSENTLTGTIFCALETGAYRIFNSVWVNGPEVQMNNVSSASFFNSTNGLANADSRSFVVEGTFTGYSMSLTGFEGAVVIEIVAGIYNFNNLYAENTAASTNPSSPVQNSRLFNCGSSSSGVLQNAELIQHSTANSQPQIVVIGFNGRLDVRETQIWTNDSGTSSGAVLRAFGGAIISIFSETLTVTSNNSDPLIDLENNSICAIRANIAYVNSWTNTAGEVCRLDEHSFFSMEAQSTAAVSFTANSSTAIFDLNTGSSVDINLLSAGTNVSFTNTNLNGSGILCNHGSKCNISSVGTITYSTNQSGGSITKGTVVLLHASLASFQQAITDGGGGNVNVLIYGLVVVAGPGPYSTTVNDFAAGTPQNCAIAFG